MRMLDLFACEWAGLFECIPPAYTEWIGQELSVSLLV